MRKSENSGVLKVNAIAGTYVVVLGFDLSKTDCEGLLGFSIHRTDHTENEASYMQGMKCFTQTDPGFPSGSLYSTKDHPWQSFQWADYSAKPGYLYTYTITALKGTPTNLTFFAETKIGVLTESTQKEKHNVYFNRGTAASQEYVRRFGNRKPDGTDPEFTKTAFKWLSRGLYEALEDYITGCRPGVDSLRIAAYEFHYEPLLELIAQTIGKGVDIQIVYDYRDIEGPKLKNELAVEKFNLQNHCTKRSEGASFISHNKFIIKLENQKPISVWTGGMNFSVNGIFGHSNVAHVVALGNVASLYLDYWNLLQQDLKTALMQEKVEKITPLPNTPLGVAGETCVFSPRTQLDALNLYRDIAKGAGEGLFMTFAFGINKIFKEVYQDSESKIRFALLEKKTRPLKAGSPVLIQEEADIQRLRNMPENVFAIGNLITTNKFDGWVKEQLTGLSRNVKYIHNKFMLVDPLGDNPIVITGSANFSNASTTDNDENMIIIRGNKRVADIYFGEYMRLFTHYTFRESLNWRKPDDPPKPLKTNDDTVKWWEDYFKTTPRFNLKQFFSQMKV